MFRVIVNGITIECETAEQALELARQATGGVGSEKRSRASGPTSQVSRWTDRRVREFLGELSTQQRRLLDALLAAPDGRTDQQLRQSLGLANNSALGGVFTGLIRNTKKVGADPDDLYSVEDVPIGEEMHAEYKVTDSFRAAAEKLLAT